MLKCVAVNIYNAYKMLKCEWCILCIFYIFLFVSLAVVHDPQQIFHETWLIEENNKTSQTVFTHYNDGEKKEDIENTQYTSLTFCHFIFIIYINSHTF
jgi:hypothetical protein